MHTGSRLFSLLVTFALWVTPLMAAPATAAKSPGRFTGYAFDTCHTPSQAEMDVWLEHSPYWGVGVYIAGVNRGCPDELSLNLTPAWVQRQTREGWKVLPLTVGLQASCFQPDADRQRISDDETNDYAAARAQGEAEAETTVAASRGLGIAKGSTQWLDIEAFDITQNKCRLSTLAFITSWTKRLHALGYRSGYYSSAASGIAILDQARLAGMGNLPDQIWIGEWNLAENTSSAYISDDGWRQQRIHQYQGGHTETYGGVTLNIDSNWMDIGHGSRAPRPRGHCHVQIDFPRYHALHRGSSGAEVKALQCLLRQRHLLKGRLTGRYHQPTVRAVQRLQRQEGLRANGRTTKRTWVAALSHGSTPLAKIGAASNAVRRLQRSLNAATKSHLEVTGVYDLHTARAVKRYQKARHQTRSGVTTDAVWSQLQSGRR